MAQRGWPKGRGQTPEHVEKRVSQFRGRPKSKALRRRIAEGQRRAWARRRAASEAGDGTGT
jgi:hypothetical protein